MTLKIKKPMLKLANKRDIILDGEKVKVTMDEVGPFLMANLGQECSIENMTVGEFVAFCSPISDFIETYFLENYHVVNALTASNSLSYTVSHLLLKRNMFMDVDSNAAFNFEVTKITGQGPSKVRDIPLVVDTIVDFHHPEVDHPANKIKINMQFTLLDLIGFFFSEWPDILRNDAAESVLQ